MAKGDGRRVVVKIGTGVLTRGVGELDTDKMSAICHQIADAKSKGCEVILVSSGAVGLGMGKLGLKSRPKQISSVQKCAAVGQGILIETWADLFEPHGITVAQLLITRDDVDSLTRHKAMRDLLNDLLEDGILPIINENDSVSAAELNIKFGDNDVLSSLVATLSKADSLMILSTAPGLIDMKGTGKVVPLVEKVTPEVRAMACGTTSATAVGGMITKIKAAEIATSSGCDVFIASGSEQRVIGRILEGESVGTRFAASKKSKSSKKRWLAHFGRTIGRISVDEGAEKALREKGSSLLPAGVKGVWNNFSKGDLVEIVNLDKNYVIARGIAEMGSEEIEKILSSNCTAKKCGHKDVVVHRDHLALV